MPIAHLAAFVTAKTFTSILALAAFQSSDSGYARLLIVFIALVTLSMVAQGVIAVVVGLGAMKARKEVMAHLLELKARALPVLQKSQEMVDEFRPQLTEMAARVETISGHVEHLTALAHAKADEISPTISAANLTAQDANLKTRAQISRIDGMVSSALDTTVRLGVAIEQGIARPSREIAGVLAGIKAGFRVLVGGARAGATQPVAPQSVHAAPPVPRPTAPDSGI